ncbi:MAG TPA: DUF222 domain-containing protein [Trebonia sp.]
MWWQPGTERGTGDEPAASLPDRDPRLPGFAEGGDWDASLPSAALAAALESASGPGWRCHGAEHDELLGLVRQWQALESWAAAGKLGVLRALIREDDEPLQGGGCHGDLPDGWSKSLTHEVALGLAMPPQSAEKLMWTAWDLHARLPETGRLLEAGVITLPKARAVQEALAPLSDADAARAEAVIAPHLPGKTFGQTEKLAAQAAVTADPGSAARRREEAERNRARVALRRDPSGAASLAGYDLPTDETLAAYANVCSRAAEYQDSGVFPGVRADQFRAMAYLDLMNAITAAARIASGQPPAGFGAPNEYGPDTDTSDSDAGRGELAQDGPTQDEPGQNGPSNGAGEGRDGEGPDGEGPDSGGPAGGEPGGGGSPAPTRPKPAPPAPETPAPQQPPRPADLIIPLTTLLGLAERPGEGYGLGPLDPALCRSLASTAASSPHTTMCVTITDPDGFATGHGCARPARRSGPQPPGRHDPPGPHAALPARLNLTIPAAALTGLTSQPVPLGRWSFAPTPVPAPPGGYRTWHLTLPDGSTLQVTPEPVPVFDCDHARETHAYQPSDTLRHLVQVRDHQCTFPTCSRQARESDFEHATPYHLGGRTCACNAGARSRACHQVKQSPGWTVTQPRPGWHQWETPSGRTYTQDPKRYPA